MQHLIVTLIILNAKFINYFVIISIFVF